MDTTPAASLIRRLSKALEGHHEYACEGSPNCDKLIDLAEQWLKAQKATKPQG